jgi:hypothetical protein
VPCCFHLFHDTSDTYDQCSPIMNHVQDQDGGLACDVKGRRFRGIDEEPRCRIVARQASSDVAPGVRPIPETLPRLDVVRFHAFSIPKTQDGSHELAGDVVQVGAEYRAGRDRYSSVQGDTRFLLGNVSESRLRLARHVHTSPGDVGNPQPSSRQEHRTEKPKDAARTPRTRC